MLAVFGALAGARRINDACVAAFGASGLEDGIVLHVTGTRDHARVVEAVTAPPERYRVIETTDRFWTVLAAADLGVSRAGGTVWELAAAGLPALLVPYPHATGDHQRANAEHFAAAGGAVIVEDAALDGDLLRTRVAELRAAPGRLAGMRDGHAAAARGPTPPRRSRASCCAWRGIARERRGAPHGRRRRRHVGHRPRPAGPRAHGLGLRSLPAAVERAARRGHRRARRPRSGAPARATWR